MVPDEDSAAIEERFAAFQADLKPKNSVGEFVVLRAAVLSVRLERCVRHESAELTLDMLEAERDEADGRDEEVARLVASMANDPAEAVRKLRRSPEGIDWMIRSWEGLKVDLTIQDADRRGLKSFQLAERLAGRVPISNDCPRIVALSHASVGVLRFLRADDWPDLEPADRRQAAKAELWAIIDAEIGRLERDRAGLDHQAIARVQATARGRALFGTSREAVLARKYEAVAEREFYRALEQVERLNALAEADDQATELDASPDETETCRESGSFFRGPEPDRGAAVEVPGSAPSRPEPVPNRPEKASHHRPDDGPRPAPGRPADQKTRKSASPSPGLVVIGVSTA